MPGHANNSATVHLGFGRTFAGHVGNEVGFNAYLLRTSSAPWNDYGLEMNKVGGGHEFATTQHTQTMEEGEPIRIATLDEYKKTPQWVDQKEDDRSPSRQTHFVSRLSLSRLQVGHDHRPELLRRAAAHA